MIKKITLCLSLFLFFLSFLNLAMAQSGYQLTPIDPETGLKTEDVRVVEAEEIDLNIDLLVSDSFYAIAPNVWWPINQLECFSFLADVKNNSLNPATGVNLNMTIVDNESGLTVYADDLNYNTIPGNTLVDNIPFVDCFTPPYVLTDYTGTYTVSSDSVDNNPSNNTQKFNFEVTEGLFSKEIGTTSIIKPLFQANENKSWAWGCYYYIVQGCPTIATSITFGIGNAPQVAGRVLNISLYKWTEDSNENGLMEPDEREKVGHNVYEIQGSESPIDLIELPINDIFTGTPGLIDLENETGYVLMVEYTTIDNVEFEMAASTQFDYRAQVYLSTLLDQPRYAVMLGKTNPLEDQTFESVGFGNEIMPVVRMMTTTFIDNVNNTLSEENRIDISPNPARKTVNVNVDLIEPSKKARIGIYDSNGKLLLQKHYENAADISSSFDLDHFARGAYFLRFASEAGSRTERFIKID